MGHVGIGVWKGTDKAERDSCDLVVLQSTGSCGRATLTNRTPTYTTAMVVVGKASRTGRADTGTNIDRVVGTVAGTTTFRP